MKKCLLFIFAICLILSGCGLFPQEASYQAAPTLPPNEQEEWKLAYVQRGDLVLADSVICTYSPAQTETLSFSVSGVLYDEIYVAAGDSVRKGQLLAQLDISSIQEEIEQCRLQLEKVNLQMAALEENRTLELQRQELLHADQETIRQINERYDLEKTALQDEKDIALMTLEECNVRIEARQLRAKFDGTVTYARSIKPGDRSSAGDRVVTVEDAVSSVFQADTKHWTAVVPGNTYIISIKNEPYEAVALSEQELGIPEAPRKEGVSATVYLRLKDTALRLEDGDRGMLELTLDSRENVLMVPESAVAKTKHKTIVYYQDENGLKSYKTVEIGLTANGMTEIISGLEEGDCVIAG